ncbi:unnamed protein product [Cochlearia groenlandica]
MDLVKRKIRELAKKCNLEAKTMMKSAKTEVVNVEIAEEEDAERLRVFELRLQESEKQRGQDVKACALKLLKLISSLSKHIECIYIRRSRRSKLVLLIQKVVSQRSTKRASRENLLEDQMKSLPMISHAQGYHYSLLGFGLL